MSKAVVVPQRIQNVLADNRSTWITKLASIMQASRERGKNRTLHVVLSTIALSFLVGASTVRAQVRLDCDTSCGGSPSTTTDSMIAARAGRQSARRGGTFRRIGGNTGLVEGSNSFVYDVPLFSLPGRGMNLNLTLHYNSFIWTLNGNSLNLNADRDTPSYGFRLDFGFLELSDDFGSGVLTEGNGIKHPLSGTMQAGGQVIFQSTDSSYIQIQVPGIGAPAIATYKSGTQVFYQAFTTSANEFRPYQIEDTNGNIIQIAYTNNNNLMLSSITDTVGRILHFYYFDQAQTLLECITTAPNCTTTTVPTYNFQWNGNYVLNFKFSRFTGTNLASGSTLLTVLTKVIRPDGTQVLFSYGDWGIVNQIQEISTTGYVRYSTTYNFPSAASGALPLNPTFTQQTVYDGVNTATWQYQATVNTTTGLVTSMAVTNPAHVTTTTTFSSKGDWEDGLPIEEQVSTPGFVAEQFCVPIACPAPPPAPVIWGTVNKTWTSDATTHNNARPASVTTTLDDGTAQSEVVYNSYDANGNLTDLLEYDFGQGGHGALLREVTAAFAPLGNSILDRPNDIKVKDASQNVVYHKTLRYDEGTRATAASQPAGRNPNFFAPNRGNLTSTTVYANPASDTGPINSTYTYDVLGNQISSQVGCCTFTQNTFSAATQYAYPDSVATGPQGNQLTTKFSYNMDTGTISSSTDMNGLQTTFHYDIDNRPLTTQTPDGITLTNSYDDSDPFASVTTQTTTNGAVTTKTLDGRGRTLSTQLSDGSTPVSTRSFVYDGMGHLVKASNPYGPNETPLYTLYDYDVLGRRRAATPPASTAGGSQNPYHTDYLGATVTVTDPAGHQRKSYRDALGRLTRIDEPSLSGGAAGAGSVTLSGTEHSVSVSNGGGATAGITSVTIATPTTADRSSTELTHAATSASVTVTIGGSNASNTSTICSPTTGACHTFTTQDGGTVSFTVVVGGVTVGPVSTPYGPSAPSTAAAIATALYNNFPANSVVTMSNPNGGTSFTLTSKSTGKSTNNSTISTSLVTSCVDTDTMSCGGPGWRMALSSSPNFAGGSDDVWTTYPDTGTVVLTITANGTTYSKSSSYSQSTTPSSIVTDLANQINGDPSMNKVVIANASGNVLSLTTVATGAGTNYPITVSSATNSSHFAAGSTSFPPAPSGSFAFTTGQNGTVYDAGTIKVTVTGFTTAPYQQAVNYSQGSTTSSIASAVAGAFNGDPFSPVSASVSASAPSVVSLTAKKAGADTDYGVSTSVTTSQGAYFSAPSFTAGSVSLSGGTNPAPSLDAPLATSYSYDAKGDLIQVTQGVQTRTYGYDGLGRVVSSTIPETGYQTVTATYKDFGGIAQITDPRVLPGTSTHLTTTFGYDPQNRLQTITYNDNTPGVTYSYNPPQSPNNTGGRLASVTTNSTDSSKVVSETYQYDLMGRPSQCIKTILGQKYTIGYSYHPDGTLASITYPSGRIIKSDEDDIGRLTQIGNNGLAIFNINSYNAAGEVTGANYGQGAILSAYQYNNQLQLQRLQYTNSTGTIFDLSYDYGGANDNGQIAGITDAVTASRSTSYIYDELGRLSTAQTTDTTSPNTWKLGYSYDRYGNRRSELPLAGTASMPFNQLLIDPSTNQITSAGFAYDAAGNMTADGQFNYTFNAADEVTSVAPLGGGTAVGTYTYDAGGLRVVKNGTVYVYSGSKVIAEYPSGGLASSPSAEHIYAGRKRIATVTAGAITYHLPDHLSSRIEVAANGSPVRTYGHYPFGATWYESGSTDKFKFTSYEFDSESGLHYAQARLQSSRIGRFLGVDPLPGRRANPQSLNRYAYVTNDPISLVDPTGEDGEDDCGPFENCDGNYAQLQDSGDDDHGGAGFWTGDTIFECLGTCDTSGSGDPGFSDDDQLGALVDDVSGSINHPTLDGVGCSCFDLSPAPSYFGSSGSSDNGSSGLDGLQAGLAVAGLVPGIGDAVNLLNAGISLFRGNYGDAALYALSAIPIAGMIGEAAIATKEVETGVSLFRAVGVREFADVAANQAFRAGGNSLEARQFATTFEDALRYADTDPGKVAILKTTVPSEVVQQFEFSTSIDPNIFKNGVVTVQPEMLPLLNQNIKLIEHVF